MASVESSMYPVGLIVLFMLALLCPPPHFGKYIKAVLIFSPWRKSITDEDLNINTTPKSKIPIGWWTDERQYQLERRAIFSAQWLYVTHASRFQKSGDYRTFEIAGFSILLILGKDNQIRAFHNVCRHRAYAVTKKECGSSIVLGCKYHGWSYDTKGKLIKAPEFDKVPGFDKSANGLWELKSTTQEGMVFVNFNTSNVAASFPSVESSKRLNKMKFAKEWTVEGAFNWKLSAGIQDMAVEKKRSTWKALLLILFAPSHDTMVPPNTIIRRINSKMTLTMRFLPSTAKSTTVNCCVYTKGEVDRVSESLFEDLNTSVHAEIRNLEVQQRNLQLGDAPPSSLIYEELENLLIAHRELETATGNEINPAAQSQRHSKMGTDDDEFCRKLEENPSVCKANADGLLDW